MLSILTSLFLESFLLQRLTLPDLYILFYCAFEVLQISSGLKTLCTWGPATNKGCNFGREEESYLVITMAAALGRG